MCNNNNNASPGSHAENRCSKRILSTAIEIRIRLIENDQEGIAIKRTSERDTLPLTRRKIGPCFTDSGAIAFRQFHDKLVHTGSSGRRDDEVGIRRLFEAADIVRHRSLEQVHILGQIAYVGPERL